MLNRIGHTSKPTAAALAILERARRIVREVDMLMSDVHIDSLSGSLRIGAISTALTGILPSALLLLHEQAPEVKPQIIPGTSSTLYDALSRELIDVAIIVQPPFEIPKRFRWQLLQREPLMLVSSKPLEQDVNATLMSEPYISYDPNSWGGRLAEQYLTDHHLAPNQLLELDGIEAISLLVKGKMGVSLLPQWTGLASLSDELVLTSVKGDYDRHVILIARSHALKDQLMQLLINTLAR